MSQILVAVAGLFGALGVGFAAIAAHGNAAATLGSASQMLLFHAPALLALGLFARPEGLAGWLLAAAGFAIIIGCGLFAGDLAMRHYRAHALFPMAAPSGGVLMILGWLFIAAGGLALLSRN